ncbi:MAG: substrate-binding domain-containing protein [Kiritimatiellia bacterium]
MTAVLFFTPKLSAPVEEKLAGAYAAARALGWTIRPVEMERSGRRARDFVHLWRPAGAIVECADANPVPDARELKALPTVWLDRDPAVRGGLAVNLDIEVSADLAFEELVAARPQALAFVGWHARAWWSSLREQRFAARAAELRIPFCRAPRRAWSRTAFAGEDAVLRAFLRSLPHGTGIFAANDLTAERVVAAAQQEELAIPGDLFVVGADNDLFLCENSRPAISSIVPDFRRIGQLSVELLARRLKEPGFRCARLSAAPHGVIRRESSRPAQVLDARLVKALELIRREAANGLRVPQVAAAMGCSRRMAELRFRAAVGHTILDEIHAVRLDRARELLSRPGQAIEPIANLCGWNSPVTLKRLFRARYGMTMRDWRARAFSAAGNGIR